MPCSISPGKTSLRPHVTCLLPWRNWWSIMRFRSTLGNYLMASSIWILLFLARIYSAWFSMIWLSLPRWPSWIYGQDVGRLSSELDSFTVPVFEIILCPRNNGFLKITLWLCNVANWRLFFQRIAASKLSNQLIRSLKSTERWLQ